MTLLNHHPLLEGILHQSIMKKDFQHLPSYFPRTKQDDNDLKDRLTALKTRDNLAHADHLPASHDDSSTPTIPLNPSTMIMDTTSIVTEIGREMQETVSSAPVLDSMPTLDSYVEHHTEKSNVYYSSQQGLRPMRPSSIAHPPFPSTIRDSIGTSGATESTNRFIAERKDTKKTVSNTPPSPVTLTEEEEETTTSTIITTTVTMTVPVPGNYRKIHPVYNK